MRLLVEDTYKVPDNATTLHQSVGVPRILVAHACISEVIGTYCQHQVWVRTCCLCNHKCLFIGDVTLNVETQLKTSASYWSRGSTPGTRMKGSLLLG